ncbi:RIP metalloprotease RseP [Ktedonobacteria bacterium brp13]|nr:RIP metalloprotease RseP [Ktedonobacteria bacterium brp13]
MNWYILAVIPVLGLLVFVHELGHFLTAKWAGIRVEEFGIGFPPNIVSIRRRVRGGWDVLWFGQGRDEETGEVQNPFRNTSGEVTLPEPPHRTLYSLNLLPIGGFVRMFGEAGDTVNENGEYEPDSFAAQSAGKRIIVLCAGVFMNFVLAIVLFTLAYSVGQPSFSPQPLIGTVVSGSPAEQAGLHPDDLVVSVNGHKVNTFLDMSTQVTNALKADTSKRDRVPVQLQVQHKGSQQVVPITVDARAHPGPNEGAMGVTEKVTMVTYPLWQAPFQGIHQTFSFVHQYLIAIGRMVTGRDKVQLSGPVGIAQMTGTVAEATTYAGWWPILSLTAGLSLSLAIFNILPFPALDGGRVFLILVELLRGGKRLKPEREGLINLVGFALLFVLMIAVTVSDIMHWGS